MTEPLASNSQAWGALEDLKVLDLTTMLAGPFCAMLLADQGANVIKIEPLEGDSARTIGPYMPDDRLKAFTGYFQSINRNKRSLALDLKSREGKEIFRRLAGEADVIVENYRAGVMDRLGLSYESLAALNPRLVYGALRGFGDPRTGVSPYLSWPAYDVVAQAMGGLMGITGSGQPTKTGPGVGDLVPAMLLAFGIMAAVNHAARSGRGQFLDVAMYDGILALCERIVYQHSYVGEVPGPEGNAHPLICPYGIFPAADGFVSIACPSDPFWRKLCEIMGRPELGRDPRFVDNERRVANSREVIALVSAWTSRFAKAELSRLLGGVVPFGPVNTIADIMADPHVEARHMLASVEQPGSVRPAVIAGSPVHFVSTPGGVRKRAPLLGEDADAILENLGLSAAEIADLRARKIIA